MLRSQTVLTIHDLQQNRLPALGKRRLFVGAHGLLFVGVRFI